MIMKNKLFQVSAALDAAPAVVPVYETNYTNVSMQNDAYLKKVNDRWSKAQKIFKVNSAQVDHGERWLSMNEENALELFTVSDSLWYINRLMSLQEKATGKLPTNEEAKRFSDQWLAQNAFMSNEVRFTGYSQATSKNGTQQGKTEEQVTELHVNYSFELDKLPVFGPGAKIKISFSEKDKISDFLYFWRECHKIGEAKVMSQEMALEIFTKNFRFAQLKPETASVKVDKMELGFYQFSPDILQKQLIPVYRVKGNVTTEFLPEYLFTHYIVAVKFTPEEAKAQGVFVPPGKAIVF